jgi:serine protease
MFHFRRTALAALAAALLTPAGARAAEPYVAGEVLVRGPATTAAGAQAVSRVVPTRPGESVPAAVRRLDRRPGVRAVPNYLAHAAGQFIPDDPGRGGLSGWERLQWNFLPAAGVDAPLAWDNVRAAGRPGARGVVIAVLDTGVAYTTRQGYRRSPDFAGTRFTRGWDFVDHDRWPIDVRGCAYRDYRGRRHVYDGSWGHGTHVAGTIAETTNNNIGLTGLAYGATVMPIRVLDPCGYGSARTIARGIRWAARHGAKLINLSLEFDPQLRGTEIPDVLSAVRYARRRGALVIGAAGNESDSAGVAYPARARGVVSVGATTENGCLADYSNTGSGLDLVAPGGGDDAHVVGSRRCNGTGLGRSIFQMTFLGGPRRRFGFPGDYQGTSMAAPHVTGTAALVIASGVIGPNPSPQALVRRLERTARPLGRRVDYGYGLVDAGRATSSG